VKLFSKNSKLYDHDTSMLQTDRETDGRTDNLALQYHAIPSQPMLCPVKTNGQCYIYDSREYNVKSVITTY